MSALRPPPELTAQKDWNSLLPYAAELQQEADEHFHDLKKGLAWSADGRFRMCSVCLCRRASIARPST